MRSLRGEDDRRAPGSTALRPGALRCESCGTTWFDRMAQYYAAACRCRRCGGRLHGERRAAGRLAVERAA
ncbi:MAG TPA: hypothetical protein VGW75_04195 [Solirubrobacteraceae bacterium]|nr:hypothetical protein [Solirubrobacteraceae bacterium]